MGAQWKIDNYYFKNKKLVEKDATEYMVAYQLDKDGDGTFETKTTQHLYDLRFENLVHNGVIFLRTIPISVDLGQKKLSVLMNDYIEGIAGGGYEVVQLNPQERIMLEKRYAAAIDRQETATFAGLPAHVATISVANTEQLKVDPNVRKQRVQLVLLHTRFVYTHGEKRQAARFPVLLLAGYANQPEDFETGLRDFHDLLNRVALDGGKGFVQQKAKPVAPPAKPVPSAAVASEPPADSASPTPSPQGAHPAAGSEKPSPGTAEPSGAGWSTGSAPAAASQR